MCERCAEAMEIAEKLIRIARADARGQKALANVAPRERKKRHNVEISGSSWPVGNTRRDWSGNAKNPGVPAPGNVDFTP